MDTLLLIKTFREVATRGGFSRAAKALDLSKANVSKYIAALEKRLGTRLLNRTTRTISLTDAGTLLLARSTPLLEMIDMTRDELSHHAHQPSGRLQLTAPVGTGELQLPALLAAYLRRYPGVHISLNLTNQTLDLVDEGIDIALRVGRIASHNQIVRKLKRLDMVVCATPAYWATFGLPTHPDELAEHRVLTSSRLGSHPEWRFLVDGEPYLVPVKSVMDANEAAPLIHIALQGMGVLFLPEVLVRHHLASGTLQPALSPYLPQDMWLYAAYTQRRHNSAAIKSMLAFMEEQWRAPQN